MALDGAALTRYSRQLLLNGFGAAAQQALGSAHVVLAGVGPVGGHVALALAGAGVGRLTLVDAAHITAAERDGGHACLDATCLPGMSRRDAVVQALNALNPSVACTAMPSPPADLGGVSLVLTCDAAEGDFVHLANTCAGHGLALLAVHSMASGGGEICLTTRAPCALCALCAQAAMSTPAAAAQTGGQAPLRGPDAALAEVLAGMAAGVALRWLAGVEPAHTATRWTLDGSTLETTRTTLTPMHTLCPHCGHGP